MAFRPLKRISHAELYWSILEGSKDVVVVDVRGSDQRGGHIPGALHFPYETFDPSSLITTLSSKKTPKRLVFHCMFSQQRGPACAQRTHDFINSQRQRPEISVRVLLGGFHSWINRFVDPRGQVLDQRMIADFDTKFWLRSPLDQGGWQHIMESPFTVLNEAALRFLEDQAAEEEAHARKGSSKSGLSFADIVRSSK
uniref:Rhodanese domain-containing protein n=1 Tax=Ditylum brightwellii TaxID=49249 RepID=A0A6U3WS96_9STRA|mmetsp:Transcript_31580/g.47118  ORF Transcript_31580/g.47118 Transcript_31580/m.47118 type:complete len:197 (+) Transcript_31580:176-766(+)